jgi:NAD(P)-dependent dehydrogenase (short-subunit alcohol dehydrogenase family)
VTRRILIAGASRGIGLGLAAEFAGRGWDVTGTVRGDEAALAATGARVERLDMADPASVDALAERAEPVDVLLVNAGVLGPRHQSAAQVTADELGQLMLVNAASPLRLARAMVSKVAADGVVAFMTSELGSLAQATSDYLELYRASKAALNMLTRTFAAGPAGGRAVLSLHPGWVRTDMGGSQATLSVEESVTGLADVIAAARGPGHRYLDYSGAELPW